MSQLIAYNPKGSGNGVEQQKTILFVRIAAKWFVGHEHDLS